MSNISFLPEAWEDYLYWQKQDKKTLQRINLLLQDILRNGNEGIGKPEPSKNHQKFWRRRIDDCNRIVYRIGDGQIVITQCGSHYRDR